MGYFEDTTGIRKRQKRPRGRLPDATQLNEMHDNVDEYVEQLKEYPAVEAISLGGGLSRGYGDALSEIDLNVYITPGSLNDWVTGRGPIPHGDHMGSMFHMDVSFTSFEKENKPDWSLSKKWDASYAKILHDPSGRLGEIIDSHDVFTAEEKHGVALRNYLDCVYYGDIVVRQWTLREDPMAAHQLLSKGIPALCNLLFLANDEYPPFEKWLVNYSHSLEWKPEGWAARLEELALVKEVTFDELEKRKAVFMGLYHEIWGRVMGEEHRETGLLELDALDAVKYVIENQPSVEEFTDKYDIKHLGYEVLFKLSDIIMVDGVEVIHFSRERFLDEREKSFSGFLEWNKEMLGHVRLSRS